MIDVFERLKTDDFDWETRIETKRDLFRPFDHDFGNRSVQFDYSVYEDGINWLMYNSKTLYTLTKDDFNQVIRFVGLTVKEFLILVYRECAINPTFFITEICRAPTIEGTYGRFVLDIGKMAQLNAFEASMNSILYNPRQSGSTLFLCALHNWIAMFRPYSANILVPSKSESDYQLYMDKVEAVKNGLPKVFFHPDIKETFHFKNHSQFTNFILVNDFEFLMDKQYGYLNTINNIKSTANLGVYPARIGFSTRVQIVGNSTINQEPSDILKNLISSKYIRMNEIYFDKPNKDISMKRIPNPNIPDKMEEILPRDYNKYILEILFDERHIMTEEELEHMSKIIPEEYYDSEIRRMRRYRVDRI